MESIGSRSPEIAASLHMTESACFLQAVTFCDVSETYALSSHELEERRLLSRCRSRLSPQNHLDVRRRCVSVFQVGVLSRRNLSWLELVKEHVRDLCSWRARRGLSTLCARRMWPSDVRYILLCGVSYLQHNST